MISSTADASKNHLTTGHLDAENEENSSIWSLVSTGGQGGIGAGMLGSSLGALGQLAKNMAGNSLGMLGGGRVHDEHSVSQSAISGNITVQAQSQSGHYLTDVSKANGALNNNFDAQKLQNQMQASQVGMRLVGETIGTVSQRLSDAGVPGFSETELSDSWARTLLEAGGNAGIAALTGGNVGAAAAGSVLGNVAATASRDAVASFASGLTGNKSDGTQTLANAISSVIASGAGAAGGLVAGGGNARFNALNGAAAASALEQYNSEEHMTVHGHRHPKKSTFPLSRGAVHTIFGGLSMVPVAGVSTFASAVLVGMDLYEGNYGEAALDSIGLVPLAGAAVKEAVFAGKAAMAARAVEGARDAQKVEEGAKDAVSLRKGEKKVEEVFYTPERYEELKSAGAAANTTGGLPPGFRRVIDKETGNTVIADEEGKIYQSTEDLPKLIDSKASQHILDGDPNNIASGGHRYGTGRPKKSEFPSTWDDKKILDEISDVATSPHTEWESSADWKGYIGGEGMVDGIRIRVIYDTKNKRIVTGYPTNTPRNPKR